MITDIKCINMYSMNIKLCKYVYNLNLFININFNFNKNKIIVK